MSRVYFHSIDGEVEIWGAERALAAQYINKIGLSFLDIKENYELLKSAIHPGHYLANINDNKFNDKYPAWEAIKTAISVGFGERPFLMLDNKPVNEWRLMLNTAMDIGSDPIKFFVRLHAQCEIHCYIKGRNRKWLSEIIEEGLKTSIYRESAGWKGVIDFLLSNDKNTVVMSYSVCSPFPNPSVLGITGEDQWEEFEKLSKKVKWEKCLKEIYKTKTLEISPKMLDVGFGDGMNVFEFLDGLREKQKIGTFKA